jgi:DNA-binding response OmpR family regulator
MKQQANTTQLQKQEKKPKQQPTSILVIDDDPEMRQVTSEILFTEGYKITPAATGKEAIDICQKDTFDLALLDIKLPDMEGTVLLQMLKKLRPTMVIIIVTGFPSLENAVQTLNLGAEGYIIKPFKPDKLLDQIQDQLEKHKVDEWETMLVNTGLSSYEAKIYLSLAMNGNSEPRKLALSSGVPRTKAYTALKKLVQRGIAVELPGRKQRFSVTTPSDAFGGFIQNWKTDITEQQKSLISLERAVSSLDKLHQQFQNLQSFEMQKQEVWVINGQENLMQRISDVLTSAKTSVSITINEPGLIQLYKTLRKTFDSLPIHGVKVNINLPTPKNSNSFVNELKTEFHINKLSTSVHLLLITADNNQLLVASCQALNGKQSVAESRSLFAEGEPLVTLFKSFLNSASLSD